MRVEETISISGFRTEARNGEASASLTVIRLLGSIHNERVVMVTKYKHTF